MHEHELYNFLRTILDVCLASLTQADSLEHQSLAFDLLYLVPPRRSRKDKGSKNPETRTGWENIGFFLSDSCGIVNCAWS